MSRIRIAAALFVLVAGVTMFLGCRSENADTSGNGSSGTSAQTGTGTQTGTQGVSSGEVSPSR